jgi:hypothetical protein
MTVSNAHSQLQPNLFGGTRTVPHESSAKEPPSDRLSIEARREIIMRIFDTADGHFISEYVKCLVEYALTHEDFIAGKVSEFYERRHGKLSEREQKSLGGVYIQLQRKGVIEKTGTFRSRNQGSPAAVYRLRSER